LKRKQLRVNKLKRKVVEKKPQVKKVETTENLVNQDKNIISKKDMVDKQNQVGSKVKTEEKKVTKKLPDVKVPQKNKDNNAKEEKSKPTAKRPEITNREMYLEYKLEYKSKYEEYSRLISEIESTQRVFSELGDAWKKAPSSDQESINKKIVTLYEENFEKTQEMKGRYHKLHNELKELKQLIKNAKQFDLDSTSVQNHT